MNNNKCAPGNIFKNGTCISLDLINDMIVSYNKFNPSNTIDIKNNTNDKKYLVEQLKKKLYDKCGENQLCWIEQPFINDLSIVKQDELRKYTFRVQGPSIGTEWLNTIHIEDIMQQYERIYNSFKFLGAVPIDFNSLRILGFSDLNFDDLLNKGKYKLGVVFNLDEHNQPGSHWVGLYANLKKNQVYFFDSYGVKPEKRINDFMNRIKNYLIEKLKKEETRDDIIKKIIDVKYNKIRHQFKGSECGVYSVNFILRMLRGDDFISICQSRISDDNINKCRRVYFINDGTMTTK